MCARTAEFGAPRTTECATPNVILCMQRLRHMDVPKLQKTLVSTSSRFVHAPGALAFVSQPSALKRQGTEDVGDLAHG